MDYQLFIKEILKITNIDLGLYKEKQMKRRIDSLIKKNRFEEYKDYLESLKVNNILFNEFVNYITINVSDFYRNPEQWNVLEDKIFPSLLEGVTFPKIWSSACSTGEEPYTLAMVLNRYFPLNKIKIIATDIDKKAIETAKTGMYTNKSIEKLPEGHLHKYFTKEGAFYKVKDDLKKAIEFDVLNLLNDSYPRNCDLIVCRNVLIYFTEEAKDIVYRESSKALKKGGILFVGSTEQIITPNKYNLSPVKTFFYIKE